MKKYILAIDQGTTGSTAILAESKSLNIVSKANIEFTQYFPSPGQVEHDLNEIFKSIENAILQVLDESKVAAKDIISIGITNQRETTCAYSKDGTPLAKAIVWQDRRTSKFCNENKAKYEYFKKMTGLPLDPYFSATKMKWLLENDQSVKDAYYKDDLLLSTIDSYILYRLSGNLSFKTEASNASRTLLMNLESCEWDEKLLAFFNVDKKLLPSIEDSFCDFGKTKGLDFLPDDISINCILGDQQAALFGQSAINEGDLKCTYGTGAFILANTGENIIHSKNGLLTTVAYKKNDKPVYALEGSTYIAGAAVQWLRDNLKIIKEASEVENFANKSELKNIEELFFFPFFTGLGAPYWKADVRASITGITRGTSNSDLSRVCLEGIAQSVCDSISAIEKDLDKRISSIRVDGGACMNNLLMQMQANFSNSEIVRPKIIETTAYGVILGSAISNNDLNFNEMKSKTAIDSSFKQESLEYYSKKREVWINTVKGF